MNYDEKNQGMQGQVPDELEARIVAWVSGEASEQEAAELARLISERPEAAAFKGRIEAARKLVAEAASADREPLRLSEERRAGLLKALGRGVEAGASEAPGAAPVPTLVAMRRRQLVERRWILAAAACLVCGLFLSTMVIPSFQTVRSSEYQQKAKFAELDKEKAASEFKKREVLLAVPAAPPDDEVVRDSASRSAPVEVSLAAPQAAAAPGLVEGIEGGKPAAPAGYVGEFRPIAGGGGSLAPLAPGNALTLGVGSPAVRGEEPIKLEAFVVDEPEDRGSYRANSTLAGTRVRTDLLGVSSAITVVTGQFLKDTGAANAEALPAYAPDPNTGESAASKEPVSTFSLHVADVSFRLAQAALSRGEAPEPDGIRPEEFYNAFNYGDPQPSMAEKVSCRTEQSADPVMQQRNLLRIAMRVGSTGRSEAQPLRLTLLLDTSGSMEREDRAAAVHRAVEVLVGLLGGADRVTLVGFARRPRLLADQIPGDKAGQLLDIISRTPPEGGTNLEEAIRLGGELALRQLSAQAQNRVVLLTDGAANLGDADPAHLAALVETMRQQGIAFDACGVGTDGINDSVLEALTRKGSGRYYVVDTPESADSAFARQLAGAFHPAAENVKVQVRFNQARVGYYRLIGFEHHRLNKEDFRNDRVAAAALAGGEAAVALYDVQVLPQGDGDLGEVYVRFRDTASGAMVERSWTLAYDAHAPAFDRASPTMQLAGTAALLAEKLRGGARGDAIRLAQLAPVMNALRGHYPHEARVQELAVMYEQMRRMRGE